MLNIKETIGLRIETERKAKGLTRKALAELTDDLKPTRINNWERGTRTPGPNEIKQLARALDVLPAFLMCLTDEKHDNSTNTPVGAYIPLLNHKQAYEHQKYVEIIKNEPSNISSPLIPISHELAGSLSAHAFALKMKDSSMEPELKIDDILLIDPEQKPHPGDFIAAKLEDNNEVIVRRYKQLSAVGHEYELLAMNPVWANVRIHKDGKSKILGTVINLIRKLKH